MELQILQDSSLYHEMKEDFTDNEILENFQTYVNFPIIIKFYNKDFNLTNEEIEHLYYSLNYMGNKYQKEALILAKFYQVFDNYIKEINEEYQISLIKKNKTRLLKANKTKQLELYVEYNNIKIENDLFKSFIANDCIFKIEPLKEDIIICCKYDSINFLKYIWGELKIQDYEILEKEIETLLENNSQHCFDFLRKYIDNDSLENMIDFYIYNRNVLCFLVNNDIGLQQTFIVNIACTYNDENLLEICVKKGMEVEDEEIDYLVKHNFNFCLNVIQNEYRDKILQSSIFANNLDIFKKYFVKKYFLLDHLYYAIEKNLTDFVDFLINEVEISPDIFSILQLLNRKSLNDDEIKILELLTSKNQIIGISPEELFDYAIDQNNKDAIELFIEMGLIPDHKNLQNAEKHRLLDFIDEKLNKI